MLHKNQHVQHMVEVNSLKAGIQNRKYTKYPSLTILKETKTTVGGTFNLEH